MKTVKWLAIGMTACLLFNFRGAAQTPFYYNYGDNGGLLNITNGEEVGNEILALSGNYLTNFDLPFYDSGTYGDVNLEIIFQLNNGAGGSPGTVFYDSGTFALDLPIGNGALDFNINDLTTGDIVPLNINATIPTDFTFSVIVKGLTGDDTFGLYLNDPPTVGTSYNDYWFNNNESGWQDLSFADGTNNFALELDGSPTPAPEPTTIAISLLSGAGLLLAARRRRQ
jgi:hypothetical protein